MAGRPLKFATPEELQEKIGEHFRSEKHLCDFLEENIDKFAKTWLGSDLEEYKREWELKKWKRNFGPRQPRIDFFIRLKNGKKIGVECKKPKQVFHEMTRAISQVLSYGVIAEKNGEKLDELILVSDKYDETTFAVLKEYKLPIRLLIIGRYITAEARV